MSPGIKTAAGHPAKLKPGFIQVAVAMDAALRDIVDHHEIRKMLGAYCHGCDRGDAARMAAVYCEESWDDHGAYKGPGKPFAARVMDTYETKRLDCFHSRR